MPHDKIANLSGVRTHHAGKEIDHNPHETCAGMTDHEMRQFMKEEQKEGMHPSLKGKHF
jgi:hypothetical protein